MRIRASLSGQFSNPNCSYFMYALKLDSIKFPKFKLTLPASFFYPSNNNITNI